MAGTQVICVNGRQNGGVGRRRCTAERQAALAGRTVQCRYINRNLQVRTRNGERPRCTAGSSRQQVRNGSCAARQVR